jgi:hypothetical protein
MEMIGCLKTLVTSYQPTPQNIPEKLKPQLHSIRSQKSHKLTTRYSVMLSADMVFMIFWLPNAIYLGVFKTVHETSDAALHFTPFFPHPHFPT